jgi:uncharacterized membrane-anchored protein
MTSPQPVNRSIPIAPEVTVPVAPAQPLPPWRLWVPLLIQTVLILAIPIQYASTLATGKTVVLQTMPVDPYDLLRGYSQSLGYDISRLENLRNLPGGNTLKDGQPGSVYVVLQAPAATQASRPPQTWQPVRVSRDRPNQLAANQIAIKGQFNGWQIIYGLETYYMPEQQRDRLNQEIQQTQSRNPRSMVVEAKVDASGNAVPVTLWVRDRDYRF